MTYRSKIRKRGKRLAVMHYSAGARKKLIELGFKVITETKPDRKYLEWVWKNIIKGMPFNEWIPISKIPYVDTEKGTERFKRAINWFLFNHTFDKVDFGVEFDQDETMIMKTQYPKKSRAKISIKTKPSTKGFVQVLKNQKKSNRKWDLKNE